MLVIALGLAARADRPARILWDGYLGQRRRVENPGDLLDDFD